MKKALFAMAALSALSTAATAQVTIYGRLGASLAQQADAVDNKEMRNDMGSRLGFRGVEDLGGGLKAVFDIQHRLNVDNGTATQATRFWDGKSIVGLENEYGRLSLGREENAAYTFGQDPADPWGTYTVAANGTILNGRIGTTRYSNSVNYSGKFGAFGVGAQIAEADENPGAGTAGAKRPYSLGGGYKNGPIQIGVGFENPAFANDDWATVLASYDFGVVKVGGFYGAGHNVNDQKQQAFLVSLTAPLGAGEVRATYGQLKNKTTSVLLDKQGALGYYYKLSKRTAVYATVARENRSNMAANLNKTGYDIGLRHDF